MADVKWIKLKVGMFDGESFKRIKRAKIGGESFRDKLTAVWFELMDFAGKCNHSGAFINSREIPFSEIEDIATMIDREEDELNLCMQFYLNEGMVEIIDNVYQLSNWTQYQNEEGLDRIREQKRIAQAKWREKKRLQASDVDSQVDSQVDSTQHLPSISISNSNISKLENKGGVGGEGEKRTRFVKPTLEEITAYCKERGNSVDPDRFLAYYESNGWKVGRNPMKDWKAAVRNWERNGYSENSRAKQTPTDYGDPEDFYK